jgi:heme-degrading monooxygenase HmoA
MSDFGSFTSPKNKCLATTILDMKIIEVDEKVTRDEQLQQDVGTVTQIVTYTVNPEDTDQFLRTWAYVAEIAKKSTPGVISAQLYRGIAGSNVFTSNLVFESTEAIRQLYKNPDFPAKLSEFPPRTVAAPHLFRKVAVPGICVD